MFKTFKTFKIFIFFLLIIGRHTILFECKGLNDCTSRFLLKNIMGRKSKIRANFKQKLITESQNR